MGEPQDVMMLETVKERHLRKAPDADAEHGVTEASSAEAAPAPSEGGLDGCRLVPRLIDLRRASEARRDGVQGSIGVDVTRSACVAEFLDWAQKRSDQVSAYGLRP